MPWKALVAYDFRRRGVTDMTPNGAHAELRNGALLADEGGASLDGQGAHLWLPVPARAFPTLRVEASFLVRGLPGEDQSHRSNLIEAGDSFAISLKGGAKPQVRCGYKNADGKWRRVALDASPGVHDLVVEFFPGEITMWLDGIGVRRSEGLSGPIPPGDNKGVVLGTWTLDRRYPLNGSFFSLTLSRFEPLTDVLGRCFRKAPPDARARMRRFAKDLCMDPCRSRAMAARMADILDGSAFPYRKGDLSAMKDVAATILEGLNGGATGEDYTHAVRLAVDAMFAGLHPVEKRMLARAIRCELESAWPSPMLCHCHALCHLLMELDARARRVLSGMQMGGCDAI